MPVNFLFRHWNFWVLTGVVVVAGGGMIAIMGPIWALMNDAPHQIECQPASTPVPDAAGVRWLPGLPSEQAPERDDSSVGTTGVVLKKPEAFQGYTLLAPVISTDAHLVDMEGRVVHTWETGKRALSTCLLENGHLMRLCEAITPVASGDEIPGRLQEFSWDSELVWDYKLPDDKQAPTHDVLMLPNGHVLMIASEKKSAQEAVAAGRRPDSVREGFMLSDCIIEVEPSGKTTGKIVWEWHAWDHLVQQRDADKPNYGDVRTHPELIDLNFLGGYMAQMIAKPEDLKKLRSIGYVGGNDKRPAPANWLHANSIAYNAGLDQLMLGLYEFSEIWIIDHGCTTTEAAAHEGGRYGKGGDLLYRCGNPRTHGGGSIRDQQFFCQHNAHWIPDGSPGAGHLLIFNNGAGRVGGSYSSVDELVLPNNDRGEYARTEEGSFERPSPVWSYEVDDPDQSFEAIMSGAERLPNGDTLICLGTHATVLEVTAKGKFVWKYVDGHLLPMPGPGPIGGPRGCRPDLHRPPGNAGPVGGAPTEGFGIAPPLYRAPRYGPDYPGLKGKELVPGKMLEELQHGLPHLSPHEE